MMITTVIGTRRDGTPAWLRDDAAASYQRMRAAGMPTGGITDAGRTNAEQWEMWWAYRRGELAATASYPGSVWSLHETGLALDLAGVARAWVRAWGAGYGWVADTVSNEPWHMVYRPELDQHHTDLPEDLMAKLDTDDYERIADHVWGRIISAAGGIGPASAEQFLQHVAVHATRGSDAAVSAAGRAQTARDQIKLHREAARKGQE